MPERTLISIIEDDQPFRDSMRKLMTALGYTVEAFPRQPISWRRLSFLKPHAWSATSRCLE